MFFSSSLRNSKHSPPTARRRTQTSPRQRAGFRPLLEALEHRWLFSTLTVTSLQDSGAGSLRGQIAAAQSGDTIVFSSALSGSSITLSSGELLVTKSLTIQGPGAAKLVISGNNVFRAFDLAQGTTVNLSGLTIKGSSSLWTGVGPSLGYGGGILNHGALTLSACTVSGAVIGFGQGGGIFNDGTLNVTGCTISSCFASGSAGGEDAVFAACGAGIGNSGTATLTNSIISNNSASESTSYPWYNLGGGIFNSGTLALTGCTVSGNYSQHEAGGIFNDYNGTLVLSGCTVSGNLGSGGPGDGGGISNYGTVTVKNSSSITGNFIGGYAAGDVHNAGVLYRDSTSTIGILDGNLAISLSKTYIGPSGGNWSSASNWTPAGAPTGSDPVLIDSGRTVNLTADAIAGDVILNGGATLNVNDNDLVLNYSGASPIGSWNGAAYTRVTGMIQSGQITSSATGALTRLGVGEIAGDVLVKYTYAGDANLDGKLNIDDYTRIDTGIAAHRTGWSNGDFNYDGKINIDDYHIIDGNIGNQGTPFSNSASLDSAEMAASAWVGQPEIVWDGGAEPRDKIDLLSPSHGSLL